MCVYELRRVSADWCVMAAVGEATLDSPSAPLLLLAAREVPLSPSGDNRDGG
jgi:hypothetical protein